MTFFEPLPPESPPQARQWAPPAWDRPSEGTLPATLIIDTLVHRTEEAAVNVQSIKVYPNGFAVNVAILFNPHTAQDRVGMLHMKGGLHRMPRLGVRFSDGRTATQSDDGYTAADGGEPLEDPDEVAEVRVTGEALLHRK